MSMVVPLERHQKCTTKVAGYLKNFIAFTLLPLFTFVFALSVNVSADDFGKTIWGAVQSGDLNTVKKMIEDNPKLLQTRTDTKIIKFDSNNRIEGQIEATMLGINRKMNQEQRTLLHIAAMNRNSFEVLKYLVDKGSDVNADDGRKMTPLFLAVLAKNDRAARYLLTKGAKPPQRYHYTLPDYETQLINALAILSPTYERTIRETDYEKTVLQTTDYSRVLRNQNASIEARTKLMEKITLYIDKIKNKKNDDIFEAAYEEDTETVKSMLKNNPALVNAKDKDAGNTPLHYAAMGNSDLTIIRYLLENGADINIRNNYGITPFYTAAGFNPNIEIIKYLAEKGADINIKSKNGGTALLNSVAGQNTNTEITKYLIKKGLDINAQDDDGLTPIISAAGFNPNAEFVKCLIENGVNVNFKDKSGVTPIYVAAALNPNAEVLKYLITKGANVNAETNETTPLSVASTEEKKNILRNAGGR
ncbi:MAG: ankyrin repeat domain-containing protein [Planctomycetaceae bacterium]|jgi:ankyrin repeat protein|nr:ankyrin repeat domain-containing protein [Planctomycetaceae bacterium]